MRHIERAERRVFLAAGPDGRLRLWGEIPGCGEACRADLAALLLEYALSHEGLARGAWQGAVQAFVERLAEAVAQAVTARGTAPANLGRAAVETLMDSFETASPTPTGEPPTYRLDECPLCAAADAGGTVRVSEAAHELFESLCRAVVQASAPGWTASGGEAVRPGHALILSLEADRQR